MGESTRKVTIKRNRNKITHKERHYTYKILLLKNSSEISYKYCHRFKSKFFQMPFYIHKLYITFRTFTLNVPNAAKDLKIEVSKQILIQRHQQIDLTFSSGFPTEFPINFQSFKTSSTLEINLGRRKKLSNYVITFFPIVIQFKFFFF